MNSEFPFNIQLFSPHTPRWLKQLFPVFMKIFQLQKFNDCYKSVSGTQNAKDFLNGWVENMNIQPVIDEIELKKLSHGGKVVFVANHPMGGLDSLLMAYLLSKNCENPKVLGNFLFHKLPQMKSFIIGVDPFNKKNSTQFNYKGMKEILLWLKDNNQLGIFPSGEVAHFNLKKFKIIEPKWDPKIAKLIRLSKANVVPMYFNGTNSWKFHLAGLLHPLLRTLLLPSELTNKVNAQVKIKIGNVIKFETLNAFKTDIEMIEHLRACTYRLNEGRS